MADSWYTHCTPTLRYDKRSSSVDTAFEQLEKTCRTHDRRITNCLWILFLLTFWIVFAEFFVVDHTTFTYQETFPLGPTQEVTSQVSKRTLHRVITEMKNRCVVDSNDIVLAPQIRVSGAPFMYRILMLCAAGQLMINPVIAVQGSSQGYCVDNYEGVEKRMVRSYPITVHSFDAPPTTYLDLHEVCPFMAAIDVLNR